MSSFRNHRIVIASLFLPTIAVIGESGPPTPEQPVQDCVESTISAVADRLGAPNIAGDPIAKPNPLNPSATTNRSSPLKSIVEDLKDKV
jgi:trehalose 6-phosphate synthase complex regulatory subunit